MLKNDIATMYNVAKHEGTIPGKAHMSRSLFYTIVKHITGGGKQQEARGGVDYITGGGKQQEARGGVDYITGGGKQQEARGGVDYIKVNFHIDNFSIVDKVINALAPQSDVDHTLCDELRGLCADVHAFLSYGYALHAREGVKASENTKDQCEDFHQPQEYEAQQVQGISGAEGVGLVSLPEKLDESYRYMDHVMQAAQ